MALEPYFPRKHHFGCSDARFTRSVNTGRFTVARLLWSLSPQPRRRPERLTTMTTMDTRMEGTNRSNARFGIIAGLALLMGALSACSAGADSAGDMAMEAGAVIEQDAAAADTAATGEDSSANSTRSGERAIITTGSLYITVEDPIAAADKAVTIVEAAGGRVDARREASPEENFGGAAQLTLRIPSDKLSDALDDLRDLGNVDEFTTSSSDVTAEVTDLEARISTLRASTLRIEGLIEDATKIEDIITLENELASRQAQLESLEAQERGLSDQVSMSTIELSLTTEPVVIVDDSPKNFLDGLQAGWGALVAFASAAAIVIGVLLPWLVVPAAVAAAIIVPMRVKKHRAQAAQQPD